MLSSASIPNEQASIYLESLDDIVLSINDIVAISGRSFSLKRSQYIYREGEFTRSVFGIENGIVGNVKILADGSRLISQLYYPGDVFGSSSQTARRDDAVALTPVKLWCMPAVVFQRHIDESSRLRRQFVDGLQRQAIQLEDRAALFAKTKAEERICRLLLQFSRESDAARSGDATIEIPLKRADMADYLGITIETVSRQLTKLVQDGVIEPRGRYVFAIRKAAVLRRLANATADDVLPLPPRPHRH